jgi:hypothetical protein
VGTEGDGGGGGAPAAAGAPSGGGGGSGGGDSRARRPSHSGASLGAVLQVSVPVRDELLGGVEASLERATLTLDEATVSLDDLDAVSAAGTM